MQPAIEAIRALVLDALAASSGADPASLDGSTRLLDLDVDSLTLASILSLAEAAGAGPLDADELAEALRADDVDALVAVIGKARSTPPA